MTNSMSKPIPRKQIRPVKTYAKPIIPLWPRATWVPNKDNSAGEKTASLKLELSTESGNVNGKTLTKSFKVYRSGTPEEWILWRQDFSHICEGMSITTGAGRNRMIRQLLVDEPLREFEKKLTEFTTETNAHSDQALDAVALQIFPNNAYAKQKKYLRQGMWKPRTMTIRNTYTRVCELNVQLLSYPNQTGVLPEDELKSAFINILTPDWQQEFLKNGINEYSTNWEDILSKAEALETAEATIAERAPAKDNKREMEEGETAPATRPSSAKRIKKTFFCKLHGPDRNHNSDKCKVLLGQAEAEAKAKLQDRPPSQTFSKPFNNQQSTRPTPWIDRKCPATTYSTEQLHEVVRMTRKKVMEEAKALYDSQLQEEMNNLEITDDRNKMQEMEVFVNN
jgi:hypothetical protein